LSSCGYGWTWWAYSLLVVVPFLAPIPHYAVCGPQRPSSHRE
jgi:hypothetical protein